AELNEKNKAGLIIKTVPENEETEEIIAKVADGEYDLTLSDSNILDIELTWRDDVKSILNMGDEKNYGWVVREDTPKLLEALNKYLRKEYRGEFYTITKRKYFEKPKAIKQRLEQRVDRGENNELSPYDGFAKEYADIYHFDWRMIVAQMYQESRFNPNARSWAGARGLMQVMPRTAKQLGIKNIKDPKQSVEAGVKYLDWLRDRFDSELPVKDRMWFTLAAYNAGAGHVHDARTLARQMGWQSNRWFGNVERAMLLLSKRKYSKKAKHGYVRGSEPVKYVREIRDRYQAYVKLTQSE
ncbi:MAG: transglycosylase SLT domain-containing protein, partial [Gammaproteobacteria bacterium]